MAAVRPSRVLACMALALAACSSPPESVARDPLIARVNRVVVAPLNLAVRTPAELAGKGEPVWHELLRYFQNLDKSVAVIAPASAEALWIEATMDLDLADRGQALRTARTRFARLLAKHRAHDVLVMPSLVLRPARMHGRYASWDGVRRAALDSADLIAPGIADIAYPPGSTWVSGLYGKISAASLHVAVLLPDGTPLYEGVGGLALTRSPHHDARKKGWTAELRPEPFADPDHLREGIELAFAGAPSKRSRPVATARR